MRGRVAGSVDVGVEVDASQTLVGTEQAAPRAGPLPPLNPSKMAWWTRLRAMLPSGPPGPLFHSTILCCQTGGLTFGIRTYLKEGDRQRLQKAEAAAVEDSRRADAAAMHALDRTAAYFNARRPERMVLELEAYRMRKEPSSRSWNGWGSGGGGGSSPAGWADAWLEQRVGLDEEAMAMEGHRVELKNLWFLAKQAGRGIRLNASSCGTSSSPRRSIMPSRCAACGYWSRWTWREPADAGWTMSGPQFIRGWPICTCIGDQPAGPLGGSEDAAERHTPWWFVDARRGQSRAVL